MKIKIAGYKDRDGNPVWHNIGDLSVADLRVMIKHGQIIRFQYFGRNNPFAF